MMLSRIKGGDGYDGRTYTVDMTIRLRRRVEACRGSALLADSACAYMHVGSQPQSCTFKMPKKKARNEARHKNIYMSDKGSRGELAAKGC